MSGRGKGGKGLGKGSAKRHKKLASTGLNNSISKPAVRRLARRGGVKRVGGSVYESVNKLARIYCEDILKNAIVYSSHAKRKTVTANDVIYSLKRQGVTMIGFQNI